MAMYE
jgi:hypothetical protein